MIESDLDIVLRADHGDRGADQKLIAEEGLTWIALMLRKNKDYGSAIFKPAVLAPDVEVTATIRVRMSDKISRLSHLLKDNDPEVEESIDDTVRDLGAYCLLYLVSKAKEGK